MVGVEFGVLVARRVLRLDNRVTCEDRPRESDWVALNEGTPGGNHAKFIIRAEATVWAVSRVTDSVNVMRSGW